MCVELKYALCPWKILTHCMYNSLLLLALLHGYGCTLCVIQNGPRLPAIFHPKKKKFSLFLQILATHIVRSRHLVVAQPAADDFVLFKVGRK
jgi:hypothetical protein